MLKKIIKHKNKLFILMLTLISALTLFLNVGKTYAYDTNQFTYTIDTSTINSSNGTYNSTNKTITTNSPTGTISVNFDLQETFTNINAYLLLNYVIEWSYDNTNWNTTLDSTTYRLQMNGYDNNQIYDSSYYQIRYDSRNISVNNSYETLVQKFVLSATGHKNVRLTFSNMASNAYRRIKIYNIDIVTPIDISLQQYYETYYGQIEENYNSLLELYNELDEEYTDLQEAYEQKQEAYDDLENDYNTLEDEYNNLEDKTNYGIFGYLQDANFQYKIQDTPFVTINNKTSFNLNELQNLGIITSGGNYNGTYFETNYNPNYEAVISNFYFNNSLPLTLIDLSFSDFEGALVEIVDENGGVARFDINSNIEGISYTNILEIYPSFSNYVDEIHITPNNAEIMGTMYTSNSYNVGYLYGTHFGFQLGMDYQQNTINDLNSQINSLNSQITDLQNTISLVQSSNEQLRNELSTLNENNMTWQKMFFTMADTPLKTVASVLGKDSGNAFLGINLYQTFIGLLTTLAIIWLIKRIL